MISVKRDLYSDNIENHLLYITSLISAIVNAFLSFDVFFNIIEIKI